MLHHPPSSVRALFFLTAAIAAANLPGCGGSTSGSDGGSDAGTDASSDVGADDLGVDACEADEHVVSYACVACAVGSTNAAGDDPSGADTACDPTLCDANQRVSSHACVACGEHEVNPAGDDPSGADTACMPDPCFEALGLDCSEFDEAYVKASNTKGADQFGVSVALSGDTLVVGAWGESSDSAGVDQDQTNEGASDSGAAYVFHRDGDGVWSQQAYLKASNADAGDQFGTSVAVSGDLIAVAAPLESSSATGIDEDEADNSSQYSGAVYVFRRDGQGDWTQEAYLKASNTGAGDFFGSIVSLSDDRLAVGAIGEDSAATGIDGDGTNNGATRAGAVYVFERSGAGEWTQEAYIKASNAGANDEFSGTLSMDGDLLIVGAMREDSDSSGIDGDQNDDGNDSGAVYVFHRESGGTWTEEAYLKASNAGDGDFFGRSVSVFGDILAVGASNEDSDATGVDGDEGNDDASGSGAVFVFARDGAGEWAQEAYLKASNAAAGDYFGTAVAVSEEWIAVASSVETSNATGIDGDASNNALPNSGAVYLFGRDGSGDLAQVAYIKASNTGMGDYFGVALALSGNHLAVGAFGERSNATGIDGDQANDDAPSAGAVYMRRLAP